MQTATIRRSIIRLAGIAAIVSSLAISAGAASAANFEVGLTACPTGDCDVVTIEEIKAARAKQVVNAQRFRHDPTDRARMRFVP
jgi:hypothetical protein